jgi:GDP-L-fucose synthase
LPKTALISGITGQDGSYLAEQVASTVGYRGGIHWDASKPDGTPKKQLDVSRLAELGWPSSIQLADGLASTYALYAQQRQETDLAPVPQR